MITKNFTLTLANLALGVGLSLVLLADTARAAVCTVPPHPRGGTQAKAATGLIDINDNRSFSIPGFQTVSDSGSGYIWAPDAYARSAFGIGAVGQTVISESGGTNEQVISLTVTEPGLGYSDDVTFVIMPPHTDDLQSALEDWSCDVLQLEEGLYFQNANLGRSLTIRGRGMGRTTISGGLLGSVFKIQPGVTVTLQDLTLIDGLEVNGGGIDNDGGLLTLERVEIKDCRAYGFLGEGGAIWNHGPASLTLIDCHLHDNAAGRDGGGVSNSGADSSGLATSDSMGSRELMNLVTAGFESHNAPTNTTEEAFNDTVSQEQNLLISLLEAIQDVPSLFAPIDDNYVPGERWAALGMPTVVIRNSVLERNKTGRGVARTPAQVTILIPFHPSYPQYGHIPIEAFPKDPRPVGFGGGIHNDFGLVVVQDSALVGNKTETDLGSYGGGISSILGAVRLSNTQLNSNRVHSGSVLSAGGGIYSFASLGQITDSDLSHNEATATLFMASGGGMKNTALSVWEIERCRIGDNFSGGGGGVANDFLAFAQIKNSTLSSNSISGVMGAEGGGLRNDKGGNVMLTGCTLNGNLVRGLAKGGGLYNQCESSTNRNNPIRVATATLQNCTISGNKLDGRSLGIPVLASGAGLYNGSADFGIANLFVSACTIVSNKITAGLIRTGGGYHNTALGSIKLKVQNTRPGLSTVQLANNIVAHNSSGDCFNSFGGLTISLGFNLDSDGSGAISALPTDSLLPEGRFRTVSNAGLSPLQNNGGPTPTHALLPGSPALNLGSTHGAPEGASLATDQRGLARSLGGRRDIGALESVAPISSPDDYETFEDQALVIDSPGVLRNDFGDGQRAVLVSGVSHGSIALSPDGWFSYSPFANFLGTDAFTYRMVDTQGRQTEPTIATLRVVPRLDLLGIVPPAGSTAERWTHIELTFDEPVTSGAIRNNVALRGSVSGPVPYSVVVNGNVVTLDPSRDFARGEEVTIKVADQLQSAAESPLWPKIGTLQFAIFRNRSPVAVDDTLTTPEDSVLNLILPATIVSNDTDPDRDSITGVGLVHRGTLGALVSRFGWPITTTYEGGLWPDGSYVYRQPAPVLNAPTDHGHLDLRPDGTLTYRPNTNFVGQDSFEYDVTDGERSSASATTIINVTPVNDAPVARADRYTYAVRNVPASNGVLANDGDVDGNPLSAVLVDPPSRGSIVLNNDGSFTYTPGPSFDGADAFTYRASDGTAFSAAARVKIGNKVPVALADTYTPIPGQPLTVPAASGLLANDSDTDGDQPLTVLLVAGPSHGTVALNADGSFTFTPTAGYLDGDQFTYRVRDGLANSVPVRVKLGNTSPRAMDDSSYLAFGGQTLTVAVVSGVLANDSDADNESLTAQLVNGPAHGALTLNADGSFSYTPHDGFVGPETFTYVAHDNTVASPAATVTITVVDSLRATAFSPARFSGNAPTNSPIRMTFNVALEAASLAGRIAIHGSLSGRHPFAMSVNGSELELQSARGFQAGEEVAVSVQAGVTGPGFFRLEHGLTWQFTVRVPRGGAYFTAGPTPGGALKAYSVALGDLNGDDRPDALVQVHEAPPRLFFNQGNGTFTERAEPFGLSWSFTLPASGLLADLNGDGSLDVVANRGTSSSLSAGLNDGAGAFTAVPLPNNPDASQHIAAGDFDGDGDQDLFVVGFDQAWVWLNDGTGHFSLGPQITVFPLQTNYVGGIAVGDVDGDGDLDVYLANSSGDMLLLNDGTGVFTLDDQPLNADLKEAARFADLDADGDLDLVLGSILDRSVWLNDGSGCFARSGYEFSRDHVLVALALGDLDGDRDFDLFQASQERGETVLINNGSGWLSATTQILGTESSSDVALADLDGDGDLDAFAINGNPLSLAAPCELWLNQTPPLGRDDFYAANGTSPITVNAAAGVLANDTAGDSGAITAVLDTNGARGAVTLNTDGSFTYTPGGTFAGTDIFTYRAEDLVQNSRVVRVKIGNTTPTGQPDGPYIAVQDAQLRVDAPGVLGNDPDFEGDPLTALLATPPAHGTLTLRADGSYLYRATSGYLGADSFTYRGTDGVATSAVVTVTLDVRSRLNLVSVIPGPNSTRAAANADIVLRFDHALNPASVSGNVVVSGSFTERRTIVSSVTGDVLTLNPSGAFLAGEEVTVVLTAGLEGSLGERQSGPVQFRFQIEAPFGRGTFADSGQRLGDTIYSRIGTALGDLDGDGDLDALVPNASIPAGTAGGARAWLNDGAGTFTDSGQSLGTNDTFNAELADLNGDGHLDGVLVQSPVGRGVLLLFNDGSGHFVPGAQTLTTNGMNHVLPGDVDNDGDNDLVGLGSSGIFRIWLNNGAGHFSEDAAAVSALNLAGLNLADMRLADLDGDGDLDVVVRQSPASAPLLLWRNDGRGAFSDSGQRFGSGSSGLGALALGDLNGDGTVDAIAPTRNEKYVWLNDGTGAFTENGQNYETFFFRDVALGEFNGDGFLDEVVVQSASTNASKIYFNDGHAQFSAGFDLTSDGDRTPNSVRVGDLNGDGALDLFLSGGVGLHNTIWFNTAAAGPIDGAWSLVINDNETAQPFANLVVRGPSDISVTVTIDDLAKGTFSAASLAAGGFTGPVGHTFTRVAGHPVAAQAAMRQLVYAPALNRVQVGASEITTFTVVATDGVIAHTNSLTTVTAISANDSPDAADDGGTGFSTTESAAFTTANVLANDLDPDLGESITIQSIDTTDTLGVVASLGNGTFNYNPNGQFASLPAGATATDRFTYTVRDAAGLESSATVQITVTGANQTPIARDDVVAINEGSGPTSLSLQLLSNDTDLDLGDSAAFLITTVQTAGTRGVVQLDNGDIRYDPEGMLNLAPGAVSGDSFRYTLSDGHGDTASAIVNVTVTGVNDSPVPGPDMLTLLSDAPATNLTAWLLTNDSDPDPGETSSLHIVGLDLTGTRGFIALTTNGLAVYQPTNFASLATGEIGTDRFAYVLSDGHGATSIGHVTITVIGTNDAPTALDDYIVFENGATVRDLTAELEENDTDEDGPASELVITGVNPGPDPKGTLSFTGGRVTYQPSSFLNLRDQEFITDSFTYELADADGATSNATVTVYIVGHGTAPVANAALWLAADALALADGAPVPQWLDQSGNLRHAIQSDSAHQPVLAATVANGRPAVCFDGTNDFMTFNLPVNGLSNVTLFLVAANTQNQNGGSSQAEQAAIFWNEFTAWGTVYLSPYQSVVNFRFGTTQTGNRIVYQRPVPAGSAFTLSTAVKNGVTDSLYVNRTLVLTQNGKLPAIAGCSSLGQLGRGYNNTHYGGYIAEVLVYTNALSEAERELVESYLDAKYTLTAPVSPQITQQPAHVTVQQPLSASFNVGATGTLPLGYQWRTNGVPIPGANNSSYTVSPTAHASHSGLMFDVVVSNVAGVVTSHVATLTVTLPASAAPTIQTQPASLTVIEANAATFSVGATGTAPLFYQWRRDGVDIPGATASIYTLSPTSQALDDGRMFDVVVTNDSGSVTSIVATLTVLTGLPTGDLALWLKADVGVVTSSPEVIQWSDQSGNNRHATQGTLANQPLFVPAVPNGRRVVRFDGVDDFLTFNLPVNGLGGMTIVLVAASTQNQTVDASHAERAAFFWNETAAWGTVYLSPFQSSVAMRFGTTQTGNRILHSRPASVGGAFTITTAIKNGTTDSLFVNGSLAVSQNGKLAAIAGCQNTGNVGRGFNNDTFFAGDIAEVLVYAKALTEVERHAVEQYLDTKYGLTAPPALQITQQPTDTIAVAPEPATFTVVANGGGPLSYQWRRGGMNIPGASTPSYVLSPTALSDNGAQFDVVVSSPSISVTSTVPQLTVLARPPAADLALWLRADLGPVLNGAAVTQWADQSGQDRHATVGTIAQRPMLNPGALNGFPVVRFDGVDDFMTFNLPVNGLGGMSIFLVAANTQNQNAGGTQAEQAALFWNETASWGTVYLSPFQSAVNFRFGTTQAGNRIIYARPASVGSAFTLSTAIKNGPTDSLYVNRSLVVNQSGKLTMIAGCGDTGNLGRGYNDNSYFVGGIAEVLVYTRAVSLAERNAVEQYLDAKYHLSPPMPPPVPPLGLEPSAESLMPLTLSLAAETATHGLLRLNLSGLVGTSYELESSANLQDWMPWGTLVLPTGGPTVWTLPISTRDAREGPVTFFRVRAK